MNIDDLKSWLSIAASLTTLLAFIGIGFSPVRKIVKKWIGDLFTTDLRTDMNAGIANMTTELGNLVKENAKDRILNNKRHVSNMRDLKVIKGRLDTHEGDLVAHRKATEQ